MRGGVWSYSSMLGYGLLAGLGSSSVVYCCSENRDGEGISCEQQQQHKQ